MKKNRTGDHIWYISDNKKFIKDYPNWKIKLNLKQILAEMLVSYKKELK